MKNLHYGLLFQFLLLLSFTAVAKATLAAKHSVKKYDKALLRIKSADVNLHTDRVATVLYKSALVKSISINDSLRGGEFTYRPASAKLVADNGIVFASASGGFWERAVSDTVKLSWYKISPNNADNAKNINSGIQAAINKHAAVVAFPGVGTYHVKSGNYWNVPDNCKLQIDGKGAVIMVDKQAAAVGQETYVMAFKCDDKNSLNSGITIKRLNIRAPDILPQWTNANYAGHKLVMAIETNGIHTINIKNCKLNDICGYGIRLKNFVTANISNITEKNVGGHFPVENGFDSFGDGIWLGHYDVQTVSPSRKNSYAKITDCVIQGYDTRTNGNFASRCGITVEGFNSYAPDIIVKVDVNNCTVSNYDRNLHVEGISSNIKYTNCSLRNFFGLAMIVKSTKTALAYDHCTAAGLLVANPKQERLGLGGAVQFNSYFDLTLTNKTVFTFNRAATFRANLYLLNGSVIDFANSDVFFDHANLHVNTGGAMINIPTKSSRGFNMYGGSIDSNGGIFSGFDKAPQSKAVFHGESMDKVSVTNSKLSNAQLLLVGGFGTKEVK